MTAIARLIREIMNATRIIEGYFRMREHPWPSSAAEILKNGRQMQYIIRHKIRTIPGKMKPYIIPHAAKIPAKNNANNTLMKNPKLL
jgi:hypothetical protein